MSVPQPSVKWLVQNGRNVLLRNAAPDKGSSSSLLNLRLDIHVSGKQSPGPLLYQSYIVPQTLNPTWTFSGMSASEDASSNFLAAGLIFKIIHQDEDTQREQTVFSEEVDLTRLVPIKRPILDGQSALPINFLILYISDELYTTERLYQLLTGKTTPYTGEYFVLEHDDIDDEGEASGTSSMNTGAAVTTANRRLQELRKDLEGSLKKAELVRLQAARRDKQAELARLRAEVEAEEARLAKETTEFEEETRLFTHTKDITGLMAACQEELRRKPEVDRVLNNKKLDLLKVRFLLEARKVKLLSELQTIYPIERLDNGEYAIRGVELPADHNSKDDEQVAAALGYTVHLLLLASKYLEIPLRYQLLFMGSRSFIRDPLVGSGPSNGVSLPLFRRNVEKDRFDRAVAWLKRAAEQLLLSRGVGYEANQCLLYNIQALFQCEMCPKLAI